MIRAVARVAPVVVIVAALAGRADADATAADRAAAEAEQLGAQGEHLAAAAKFREAFKADQTRTNLFCNIGISYYKAGQASPEQTVAYARAHLVLSQCLEQTTLEPQRAAGIRTALASVEAELHNKDYAPVRVVVEPGGATVAVVERPEDVFVGNHVVWLPKGTSHIVGKHEGYRDETIEVVVASTEATVATLTLQRNPIEAPPRKIAPERPSRLPAIIVTAGTAAAIALAGVSYFAARSRADLARSALDVDTFNDDKSAVDQWNTLLGVGGALAIVGAGAAGYLWYRALHAPEGTAATVEVGDGGARVTFSTRF